MPQQMIIVRLYGCTVQQFYIPVLQRAENEWKNLYDVKVKSGFEVRIIWCIFQKLFFLLYYQRNKISLLLWELICLRGIFGKNDLFCKKKKGMCIFLPTFSVILWYFILNNSHENSWKEEKNAMKNMFYVTQTVKCQLTRLTGTYV